ncbi:hypothetical protein EWM64_g4951 [Hericium alpestre]|uniref:Uncharacterized protein n=1 Tax=Hericium alpestre TaxID=135208 RepID=A0A4Y9ZW69_9AGAM|nr:hypothetical protein EWM64_g4951 [Hericium alpestre]
MSQPTTYAWPASPFFRHRPLGRAPSPPTWACYEQIHSSLDYNPDYSCSDSEDEHDDELDDDEHDAPPCDDATHPEVHNMDVNEEGNAEKHACATKDKGKQCAVEPTATTKQHIGCHRERKRHVRQPVITLRPILIIQCSQVFVWNQDLFVPPYIKDCYVASTSPPSGGYIFTSASSMNTIASINDYEVEVVEIYIGHHGVPKTL